MSVNRKVTVPVGSATGPGLGRDDRRRPDRFPASGKLALPTLRTQCHTVDPTAKGRSVILWRSGARPSPDPGGCAPRRFRSSPSTVDGEVQCSPDVQVRGRFTSLRAVLTGTPSRSMDWREGTSSCEGAAEGVAFLRGAGDAAVALEELLGAGGGERAGRAVEGVDGAGVQEGADVFEGGTDGQVGEGVVVVVAGAQGGAGEVAFLGGADQAAVALEGLLVAGGGQPVGGAVQDVDRAGVGDGADVLADRPDGQVGRAVVVEVPGGQGEPEDVAVLSDPDDPTAALEPLLVAGGGQPVGGAIQDVDGPGIEGRADVLEGGPDSQVGEGVVVEVATGEGEAELVADLGHPANPAAALEPLLVPGGGEPADRAVQDGDRTGLGGGADAFGGHPDGQVGEAVVVEVPDAKGGAEAILGLGGTEHPRGVLGEELAAGGSQSAG